MSVQVMSVQGSARLSPGDAGARLGVKAVKPNAAPPDAKPDGKQKKRTGSKPGRVSVAGKKQNVTRLLVLSRRSDFLRLLNDGHRLKVSPWLLLNFSSNELGRLRCGWTLPRKVGSAVVRNKLKRWAREYFRALIRRDGTAFAADLNLVFRKSEDDIFKNLDYESFSKVLDRGWSQVRRRLEIDSAAPVGVLSNDRLGPPRRKLQV